MKRIAILSSTNGTNLQSFIDARERGELEGVRITCLITNKADCGAVEKAKKATIPVYFVDPKDKDRQAYDRQVMAILEEHHIDLVVLGGYMRIIGEEMVRKYKKRILNVHPSLLPRFGGKINKSIYQAVLEVGEKETGMTIHFVDEGVDTGEIVLQKKVSVDPADTVESLKEKVQGLEKEWYPKVVRTLLVNQS